MNICKNTADGVKVRMKPRLHFYRTKEPKEFGPKNETSTYTNVKLKAQSVTQMFTAHADDDLLSRLTSSSKLDTKSTT